jgi:hypothetical protein
VFEGVGVIKCSCNFLGGVIKMFMSVHKGGGGCKKCPESCSRSL